MKKNIAVALSGGIDSLVTAFLLKKDYPNLFGIHFKTGYEAIDKKSLVKEDCCNLLPDNSKDIIEALEKQLNIPIYSIDLKEQFKKEVILYFIETYKIGKTPNPCVVCNKNIKFGALYESARSLGADFLATGHYARIYNANLLKGRDKIKDQSYFLSMLSSEQLSRAVFPLGDLTKKEVTAIAEKNGLVPIEKKESQDICFINNNSFADFISLNSNLLSGSSQSKNNLSLSGIIPSDNVISGIIPSDNVISGIIPSDNVISGDIITTDNKIVGKHKGLYCYTIGQRRGLNCPGKAPYYVKSIDVQNNRLIVGFKEELFEKDCYVRLFSSSNFPTELRTLKELRAAAKIRYSHSGAASTLFFEQNNINDYSNRIKVIFDEPQLAVTPGQCAVFYDEDKVIGAGFIER